MTGKLVEPVVKKGIVIALMFPAFFLLPENAFAQKFIPYQPPQHLEFMCPSPTIYFDAGSAQLTAEDQTFLRTLPPDIDAHCSGPIVVTGFSDSRETAAGDLSLSEKRAEIVAQTLIADGIDSARVHVVWLGDRYSQGTSLTAAPLNRRVTIESPETGP